LDIDLGAQERGTAYRWYFPRRVGGVRKGGGSGKELFPPSSLESKRASLDERKRE